MLNLKNQKSTLCLYFFGLFCCALRTLPFPTHLNGKDTFAMCGIISNLIEDGNFVIITNFLSYFGLADPSYSLGALSLGGSLQLATTLNIEETILMYTFATFFLAYSAAFLAGHRFTRDKFGAFFAAILFMTAPDTLQFFGNWNFSTRTLLLTFLPVFVLVLFLYLDEHRMIFLYMFGSICLISFSFHRSSYFSLFLVSSLISLKLINLLLPKKGPIIANRMITLSIVIFVLFIFYMLPILMGRVIYLEGGEEVASPTFKIIENESPIGIFINLAANYAMAFGFLLTVVLVGTYSFFDKYFIIDDKYKLILIFLVFYSFIWVELIYAPLYFIIYLSLLSSKGLVFLFSKFNKFTKHNSSAKLLVVFFVVFLQYSPLLIVVDNTQSQASEKITIYSEEDALDLAYLSNSVSEQTIDLSNYLHYQSGDIAMFSNFYSVEIQVRVYSEIGPRPHAFAIQEYERYTTQLDFEKAKSLILGKQVSLSEKQGPDYPSLKYSLYYNDNPTDEYISKTLKYNIGGDGRYHVFMPSSSWNRETWNEEESLFLIELESNNYVTYVNTNYEIKYYVI